MAKIPRIPQLPQWMAAPLRDRMVRKRERFPRLLSVEITNVCNSDCIMCPHGQMERKLSHMPLELFEKVLDDCQAGPPQKINLFWFGDSFCNPRIVEYLRRARAALPGSKLYISTNAELLRPEWSDQIIAEELLDVINFDIDGTTKETYENIRVGVNFDTVLKNVHYFLDRKAAVGKRKPQTRATIIKMEPTAGEIEDFRSYWKGKMDVVDVNDYNTWLGEMPDLNTGETAEHSSQGAFTYPCLHPWDELVIGANGTAGLCCLDYDLTAPVGSVVTETIQEIWQGPTMREYREKLLALQYDKIGCCANCNAYIYQDRSTWAKLWRAAPADSALRQAPQPAVQRAKA